MLIILIIIAVCTYIVINNKKEKESVHKQLALREIAYGNFDLGLKMLARYNAGQDRKAGVVCDCEHCKDNA